MYVKVILVLVPLVKSIGKFKRKPVDFKSVEKFDEKSAGNLQIILPIFLSRTKVKKCLSFRDYFQEKNGFGITNRKHGNLQRRIDYLNLNYFFFIIKMMFNEININTFRYCFVVVIFVITDLFSSSLNNGCPEIKYRGGKMDPDCSTYRICMYFCVGGQGFRLHPLISPLVPP